MMKGGVAYSFVPLRSLAARCLHLLLLAPLDMHKPAPTLHALRAVQHAALRPPLSGDQLYRWWLPARGDNCSTVRQAPAGWVMT